jgi:hypothetical protein
MTDQPTGAVDRIPLTHSVRYVVRGLPEVPNQYGPGVLAPSEITLTYRTSPDSQLGRVHAYVAGRLWADGKEIPLLPGGLYGQHYDDGVGDWPEWLAEEARLHDPDAVPVSSPPPDQTALRDRIVAAMRRAPFEDLRADWNAPNGPLKITARINDLADAVLAVLPLPADRAAVKQRADCTEIEWAEQERARFERLYTRESVRADTAEERADTAARDADIYQQRLERLGEGYTRERKRAERAEAESERLRTYRDATCICQHTEQQHFEDACLTCDCGDYLTPAAAREVIARYQEAVKREPADRGAALSAAAQHLYTALFPAVYDDLGQKAAEGVQRAVSELRRLAAEAQQPETPNTDRAAVYREVADRLTTDAQQGMQPDWARIYKRDAANKVREWAEQLDGEGRQDDTTPRPVQHAPGNAVLCPNCRTKGHAVCMDGEEECCGAEPPSRADDPNSQWGDCWCTLRPGHDSEHRCEPCTERHGAPGWTDRSAAAPEPPAHTGRTADDCP